MPERTRWQMLQGLALSGGIVLLLVLFFLHLSWRTVFHYVEPGQMLALVGPSGMESLVTAQSAADLSPTDLENRGWTCFPPPVPNRIVCSRPNQGFPTIGDPPPADRPATFTFLVFDGNGRFVGTEILIRTELYKGQLCESTGQPYVFVPVIGYFECVHTAGH